MTVKCYTQYCNAMINCLHFERVWFDIHVMFIVFKVNSLTCTRDIERLNYVFGSIHDSFNPNTQVFTSTAENGARPKTQSKSAIPVDVGISTLQVSTIFQSFKKLYYPTVILFNEGSWGSLNVLWA